MNSAAKKENSSQVDLRVHGVSQDDIYRDEEWTTRRQNLVDRLLEGYRNKSIIVDLKQEGVSNVFSEESKRKLKKIGNIELYEFGVTVRTTPCPTCLVTINLLWLSQEQTDKIKRRTDILADPLYVVKRGRARERHEPEEWQYHHWKSTDAARNCKKRV